MSDANASQDCNLSASASSFLMRAHVAASPLVKKPSAVMIRASWDSSENPFR
jgi:hypothetical protein